MIRSLRPDPPLRPAAPPAVGPERPGRTYGFLSTYPPTVCGLATFTEALYRNLVADRPGDRGAIVRLVDGPTMQGPPEAVYELDSGGGVRAATAAAGWLNRYDVAVVQHEYGIFGGRDGEQVLAVLDRVRVPVIAVLHSVPAAPTAHQRRVLEQVVHRADAVVTMTEAARDRLAGGYRVEPGKLSVIPRGAWAPAGPPSHPSPRGRQVILSWGLLGPGKGIESGIAALPALRSLDPAPSYVIAGPTHPRVLAQEGERYRGFLHTHAGSLGVTDMVQFEPGYRSTDQLRRLVHGADVVLLPYDSVDQVASGVLVEAVASGTPVVATRFPHAEELLAGGAGLLVPQQDPAAIGEALRRVLTEPALAASMSANAARTTRDMTWPAVAECYRRLAESLLGRRTAVAG